MRYKPLLCSQLDLYSTKAEVRLFESIKKYFADNGPCDYCGPYYQDPVHFSQPGYCGLPLSSLPLPPSDVSMSRKWCPPCPSPTSSYSIPVPISFLLLLGLSIGCSSTVVNGPSMQSPFSAVSHQMIPSDCIHCVVAELIVVP